MDASAWIAIFYERDIQHGVAAQIYNRELLRSRFITSNWTIYEAYSFIKKKSGIGKAIALKKVIENRKIVKLERVTIPIEKEALELFWSYKDKDWGIVDITSLFIMTEYGCRHAFAFDRHFDEAARQNGFEILSA